MAQKAIDTGRFGYSDLDDLVNAVDGAGLESYAAACGHAHAPVSNINYTLSIVSLPGVAPALPECADAFKVTQGSLEVGGGASATRGRCLRCPMLVAGVQYQLLVAGASTRQSNVARVSFTLPTNVSMTVANFGWAAG